MSSPCPDRSSSTMSIGAVSTVAARAGAERPARPRAWRRSRSARSVIAAQDAWRDSESPRALAT